MRFINRGLFGVVLLASLTACGGGGSFGGSSSGGSTGTGAKAGSALVELGDGSESTFKTGELGIQVTSLSAGGSTVVTANIVDANNANALYTAQPVSVGFTSDCISAGKATITTPVSTQTGTATTTYTAAGCSGSDTIIATATVGTSTLTAKVSLTVKAPTIGSMQFIGALPASIGLKGMGGNTTSKVTFQVNDANGHPVSGVTVNFTLSTTLGGITLTPASAVTDNTGQVFTFVQAGSQHTSVGVSATATLSGKTVTSGSSSIIVSTGIPTQNNFTIAVATHNIEAWHLAGITDVVTVFLSDRFQNPVPDGTAVSITTDGGAIETGSTTDLGGCVTANGTCTVNLRSQEAWPDPSEHPDFTILGHAHIFAYTIGEESFDDANGNGLFDSGETFDDLPEVFQDRNEDGTYHSSSPTDFFYDFNKNNQYDGKDGLWEGVLCNAGSLCGGTSTGIGGNECVVFSTSYADIGPVSNALPGHSGSVTYVVSDENAEVLAEGTKISIAENNVVGVTLTLTPDTSTDGTFAVPDTGCAASRGANWPKTFTVTITPTPGASTFGGTFQLEVQSPSGATTLSGDIVTIN